MVDAEQNTTAKRKKREPVTQPALLRIADVQTLTSLTRSEVYRKMDAGTFPRARKLGERTIAWHAAEVEAWIASVPEAASARAPIAA